MKDIRSLLSSRQSSITDHLAARQTIAKIISAVVGVEVNEKAINIKVGTVIVSAHPTVKTEIKLRQEAILKAVKTTVPNLSITSVQ